MCTIINLFLIILSNIIVITNNSISAQYYQYYNSFRKFVLLIFIQDTDPMFSLPLYKIDVIDIVVDNVYMKKKNAFHVEHASKHFYFSCMYIDKVLPPLGCRKSCY